MKHFYDSYVLPYLVHHVCANSKFSAERQKTVPRAKGVVVELGMGSGLNLPFYDPAHVTSVTGIDPSFKLTERAACRMEDLLFPVETVTGSAEELPVDDNSTDTVLSTFTLCTIPDLARALDEARRVLKPGGCLVFCEHGLSEDTSIAKWQNRLNPLWRPIAGGCHLNRDIPKFIEAAGFEIEELQTRYMEGTPSIGSFLFQGIAVARE